MKLARISFDLAMVSAIENDHVEVGRTIGWFTWKFDGTVAPTAGGFAVAFAIGARRTPMLPRCLEGVGVVLGVAAAVTGFAGGFIVFVMGMVGGAGRDRDLSSHPHTAPDSRRCRWILGDHSGSVQLACTARTSESNAIVADGARYP